MSQSDNEHVEQIEPASAASPASAEPAAPATSAEPDAPAEPSSRGAVPRRRAGGPRRAVRRGTEREAVLGVSADERPAGWGDGADTTSGPDGSGHGSNDEQLRRDVPPHWS